MATTVTAADGSYILTAPPGRYFVHIPVSEFADTEPLDEKVSTTGQGGADNEIDDNATGGDDGDDNEADGVSSLVYDLQADDEPDNEAGFVGTTGSPVDNNNTNGTADFGFYQPVSIGNLVWMDNGAGAVGVTAYDGAVILVSHDPHLVECVADRLWLVKDGAVRPFEQDLDAYRALLLGKPEKPKTAKPRPKQPNRNALTALKAEVTKCEARVAKLEEMRNNIDARLAAPTLYERGDTEEIEKWQKKRAEVITGLDRAEALWMKSLERLEAAGVG